MDYNSSMSIVHTPGSVDLAHAVLRTKVHTCGVQEAADGVDALAMAVSGSPAAVNNKTTTTTTSYMTMALPW